MSTIKMKARPAAMIAVWAIDPRGAGRLMPPATRHRLR